MAADADRLEALTAEVARLTGVVRELAAAHLVAEVLRSTSLPAARPGPAAVRPARTPGAERWLRAVPGPAATR